MNNVPAVAAITSFLFFCSITGTKDKNNPTPIAKACCTSNCISMDSLKKFMLDSLHDIQFEGGVYSKNDLLMAINSLNNNDDSIYILNVLINCNVSRGTDLAITSRHTAGVSLVSKSKSGCTNCPPKSCCPKSVGIARINRHCLNNQSEQVAATENRTDTQASLR